MKIKEALALGNYSLDAEVLLCHILKKDKAALYSHQFNILSSDRTRRYQKLIFRRKTGEPVAYLTHHQEFFGLDFYINKNVLIPRPESELLVEESIEILKSYKLKAKKLRILDLGTGAGCIIVAIATNLKSKISNLKSYAADISKKALKIAQKNAKKHKVKINFIKSDLFKNIPTDLKFDLIIANLPYLWHNYPPFEPKLALDGGREGLEIIEKFLRQVKSHLSKKSAMLLEIDSRQAKKIKKLSKKYLPHKKLTLKKDLAGLDRVVILS